MTPLFKNTYREILRSPGRFLAILAIIVLGSGFFVGLRVSENAMAATASDYYSETSFHDFSLASTLGLTDENLAAIAADPDVMAAEGSFETDALVTMGGVELVYSFHSLPTAIDTPALVSGRLPQAPNECLADSWTGISVGQTVTLSASNDEDTLDLFKVRSFTVTGIATSPLYLNFERGSTQLGSGSVAAFCYVPMEAFDTDYYTGVYVRCHDMPDAYSHAYEVRADELEPRMTALAEAQARARYNSILADGQSELDDAEAEYADALAEYRSKRADAQRELDDAKLKLDDGKPELDDAKAQIDDGWREYNDGRRELADSERTLADAKRELDEGKAELDDGARELDDAKLELDDAKAQIDDGWREYNDGLAELQSSIADGQRQLKEALAALNDAKSELDAGEADYAEALAEYEDGLEQYNEGLEAYNSGVRELNDAESQYSTGLDTFNAKLQEYNAARAALDAQKEQIETLRGSVAEFDATVASLLAQVNAALPPEAQLPDVAALMEYLASAGLYPELVALYGQMPAYREAIAQYDGAVAALDEAGRELDEAEAELDSSRSRIDDGWRELEAAKKVLDDTRAQLDDAKSELDNGRATLDDGWREYEEGRAEYNDSLLEFNASVDEARTKLDDAYDELRKAEREYESGLAEYNDGVAEYEENLKKYNDGVAEYEDGLKKYNDGAAELENAAAELADAEAEYAKALDEYNDGLSDYEDAKADMEREFADAEAELADARDDIDDARRELDELEPPDSFALGRWSNLGYVCFENDTSIVRAISAVFPLFFFLVAALICLTTVSRMVEEQRSQLGVLMALGYSRPAIMGKFLAYSGTATVLGAASGILLGSKLIPMVVWKAYNIMYTFSDDIRFVFDLPLSAVTFSLYVVSMLAVTFVTCRKELRDVPANIIRPKPPKAGKRVILERIPIIWERLSFLWKVTIRNIFRYKSRVLMMILGIAGCTALMITGMGVNDSVRNVVDYQFTEISLYDYSVTFSQNMDAADRAGFLSGISGFAENIVFFNQESVTASAGREEKEVQLNVLPGDALAAIPEFIDFHQGPSHLSPPDDGKILVNSGLADSLDLRAGDSLTLRNDDGETMELTVCGVYDNYIYNSVFITESSYVSAMGRNPDINYALIMKAPDADAGEGLAAILSQSDVLTSTSSADMRERIGGMMDSLIYIVLLTIVCAAALAFVVIYNLTNINIQERLREIATVKVLGFYDSETALYVLRENILLTVLGAAAGIPLGLALNAYVVSRIELDMIHFTPRVLPLSYFWSVLLTFAFSLVVDLLMLRRLARVNPAEALKSAE